MDLFHQSRDDVGGGGVEVVARPVEVDGEHVDGVEAVLGPVGLGLDEQRFLGDAVGRVRLFRVAVPQILFAERNGRVLGVGADGAGGDELGHAGEPGLLEELGAHHQVVEKELARLLAVEADAADLRRQVDHEVRSPHDLAAGVPVAEIVLAAARDADLGRTLSLERGDQRPAEEAGAARHQDALAPQRRLPPRSGRHAARHATRRAVHHASPAPLSLPAASSSRSASTIIRTRPPKSTSGCQPSFSRALLASPIRRSTSAGRK